MPTEDKHRPQAAEDAALDKAPQASAQTSGSSDAESWVSTSMPGSRRGSLRSLAEWGLFNFGVLSLMKAVAGRFELHPAASPAALPRWRRARTAKSLILCYHGVGETGLPVHFAVPTQEFEEQMRWLTENYRVLSMDDFFGNFQAGGFGERNVVVTFDDGYRNTYTEAFPILQKYRVPATIFLTVEAIESGRVSWYDRIFLGLNSTYLKTLTVSLDQVRKFALDSTASRMRAALEIVAYARTLTNADRINFCQRIEAQIPWDDARFRDGMLTWDQIRCMLRVGISFGSHTLTHPVVSSLSNSEMERELADSKRILEHQLGTAARDFAFPFGKSSDCGPHAMSLLPRLGYRSAVITIPGTNAPGGNPFELLRVTVGGSQPLSQFACHIVRHFLDPASNGSESSSGRRLPPASPGIPRAVEGGLPRA